jgi:hypothetical protein
MKNRLFIVRSFAHAPQSILATVWALAFLLAYLVWDFAFLIDCDNATAHTSRSDCGARSIGDTERKFMFRHALVSHAVAI